MSKVKLIYNYDLPNEEEEFRTHQHARDYFCIIEELLSELRKKVKYGSETMSEDKNEAYEEIRSMILEMIEERGIGRDFF
jgi:hypothetical protein